MRAGEETENLTMKNTSCKGCKFLYTKGEGYSNWTWLDTIARCALDKNPSIPKDSFGNIEDLYKLQCIKTGRCDRYAPGVLVELDVDGDDTPWHFTDDREAIVEILASEDRIYGDLSNVTRIPDSEDLIWCKAWITGGYDPDKLGVEYENNKPERKYCEFTISDGKTGRLVTGVVAKDNKKVIDDLINYLRARA